MNKLTKERLLYNLVDSFNDIIDEVSVSVKNVSISGRDITITKTDGTTSKLTTQDTVYTLPTATSSVLGGVKIGSNITNSNGTISITKDNVTSALGYTPPTQDTTYSAATSSALGLVKVGSNITNSSGTISLTKTNVTDALGYTPPTQDTVYTLPTATSSILGGVKVGSNITNSSGTISLTKDNITSALGYTPPTQDTTYSNMTAATSSAAGKAGLVPAPGAGKQTSFLRGDGTWVVPTNTTYTAASATPLVAGTGAVGTSTKYAREDHVHPAQTTVSGNAGSATKLETARTIAISGGATGTATSFNGSANITIPVTALDMSKATAGTLAVARGGTGLTASPSMLTNLASTSAANVLAASPRPGVTGILPIANGGTGSSTKNFVDLSSAQSVAGNKTFSGITTINKTSTASSPLLSLKGTSLNYAVQYENSNITKGTTPTAKCYMGLEYYGSTKANSYKDRLACQEFYADTSNNYELHWILYNPNDSTSAGTNIQMGLKYQANGATFAYAPTPSADSNTNHIATTAWVRSNVGQGSLVDSWQSGTSWYRKYSDGWIEQGGIKTFAWNTNNNISFNTPFTNTNYTMTATSNGGLDVMDINSKTTTGCSVYKISYNDADSASMMWMACGY